jgi:muramoyltetrapeptide carboxypeptidase
VRFRRLHALRPGDPIRVIAPAGPFDRPRFEKGLALLAARYQVRHSDAIFARHRYLAGDDASRLADLKDALADNSRALFLARGGFGSAHLLAGLRDLPAPQKPIVGFSDLTSINGWLAARGQMAVHAPVITQLGRQPGTAGRLFQLLESDQPLSPLIGARTLVPGIAEGPLLGGNLAVFSRLVGTPFLPNLEGAVLLLEDVTEKPYQIDRIFTHLTLAGVFRGVKGLALGTFTECEERGVGYTSAEVIADLARGIGLPCAANFPIGHGEENQPVPLGALVRLDAGQGTLEFLEPAVEA